MNDNSDIKHILTDIHTHTHTYICFFNKAHTLSWKDSYRLKQHLQPPATKKNVITNSQYD